MKTLTPFLVLGSLLALTACPDGTGTTDDTDGDTDVTVDCDPAATFPANGALSAGDYAGCNPYTGDATISYFPAPTCAAAKWDATVETRGWGSGSILYMHDSAGGGAQANWWGEEHDMAQGSSQQDGWWDQYKVSLDIVGINEQEDGVSSFLDCNRNDQATLVWGIELFEYEGTAVVDCVIIAETAANQAFKDEFKTAFANMDGCDELDAWTAQ
ncbi:MAG: hypothetical protein AB8H79_26465 [Myxococcota bacterium]